MARIFFVVIDALVSQLLMFVILGMSQDVYLALFRGLILLEGNMRFTCLIKM